MLARRPDTGLGHYLRDLIYGASDGIVTTLAIVAGTAGAAFEPRVGLVLGLAKLAADGLSMGASNYLGLKAELDQIGVSPDVEQPWRHGVMTVVAFMIAGAIPLLCYVIPTTSDMVRLWAAGLLSAFALAFVGASRSLFLQRSAWRGALEMLIVAGGAALIAYFLGRGITAWVGTPLALAWR